MSNSSRSRAIADLRNASNVFGTRMNKMTKMSKMSKKPPSIISGKSRNLLNNNKRNIVAGLRQLGQVDTLDKYNNIIKNKSCYNSIELLRIYSQYKFVIAFENSKTQGYITEKIFNVFLAKSIPIYDGDPRIYDFINPNSFLQYNDMIIQKVKLLMNNEELYNSIIEKEKIKELDYTFINNNFDRLITDVQKVENL